MLFTQHYASHIVQLRIYRDQHDFWQDTEEDAETILLQQQMERLKGSNSVLRSSIIQVEQKVTKTE